MREDQKDQGPTPTQPRRTYGAHLAIAAIAAFGLLLALVLFYRGDRPTDEPLEMSAEERAASHAPLHRPSTPSLSSDEGLGGDDAGASEAIGPRAEPDEAALEGPRPAPRLEASSRVPRQKKPRADLDPPDELRLGAKPAEQPVGARARPAAATETGRTITAEEIQRVVGDHEREVKSCFENLAKSQKIEVELKVAPSGAVAGASVKNPLPTRESECIETKAKSWKFDATGGEVSQRVTVPFVVVTGTG